MAAPEPGPLHVMGRGEGFGPVRARFVPSQSEAGAKHRSGPPTCLGPGRGTRGNEATRQLEAECNARGRTDRSLKSGRLLLRAFPTVSGPRAQVALEPPWVRSWRL